MERADMEGLVQMPAFHRFLGRVMEMAGIHAAATNRADGRNLVNEGRRDLGLSVLRDAARGMPSRDPQAAFELLLIQLLRERAQSVVQEKPTGRRDRYDAPDDPE